MSDCLYWPGFVNSDGYGIVPIDGSRRVVHRLLYELYIGPVADEMHVDHQCHNDDPMCPGGPECMHRRCINLEHLEPATCAANVLRGVGPSAVNARRTHCKHGHLLDYDNTYIAEGRRRCRACGRRRRQEWVERQRSRGAVA